MDDPDLDALLLTLAAERPSAALRQRVLATAPRPRPERRFWWSLGLGWATAAVAGVIVGAALPPDPLAQVDQMLAMDDALYAEAEG